MAFLCPPCVGFAGDIVLLHSLSAPSGWTESLERGLVHELGDAERVAQVYLGTAMDGDEHFNAQLEKLVAEWGDAIPSAVVTDGPVAFAFMRKYREEIFVTSPVIYCGMPRPEPELLRQCGECNGIPLAFDPQGTVGFIFALRPKTATVVGIMDGSPESRALKLNVEAAMESYQGHAQVLFPGYEPGDSTGLDMEALASVASSVPRLGAVLFLGFAVDNKGNRVDEASALRMVVNKSVAPVFCLSDQWLAEGALGGVLASGYAQGQDVGRMVKGVLSGEAVREMLAEASGPKPTVDLTVLARFGIPVSQLSAGTVTVNAPARPDQPEEVVPTGVVAGISLVGLVVFIGFFIVFRRRAGRKDTLSE